MEAEARTTAEVVDFSAYRAKRQQRTLWEEDAAPRDPGLRPRGPGSLQPVDDLSLSERQLAHRRRMLAFLLTPR